MTLEQIGRYQIIQLLGSGGSSNIYRAHDSTIGRDLAIKLLPKNLLNSDDFRARFQREARIIASLEHPAIVPVYDVGEHDGQPFLVVRYMPGGSLRDRLAQGPIPPQEANIILRRIADALYSAHKSGIVHRNIKPSNILFDGNDLPYLSDFGIAHIIESNQLSGGVAIGTPAYMPPEQILNDVLDGRADIYQLGVVLFEVLTGQLPYTAGAPIQIAMMHVQSPIPSLRELNPALSPQYDKVIQRAMAKKPEDRYSTALEMLEAFAAQLESSGKIAYTKPIDNPFVVGNPVKGDLFVGRAGILRQLEEILGNEAKQSVDSVVLFGHRRMGKTSILHNLEQWFGKNALVTVSSMQLAGLINSTGDLLSYLALTLYDALEDAGFHDLPEPDLAAFERTSYQTFNRFLRSISKCLGQQSRVPEKRSIFDRFFSGFKGHAPSRKGHPTRVILAIDEFELIETAITNGHVDMEFLDYLRGVIHSESWLILILAGLHTLEEMTADYWNPLFASVTPVRVSFLSRADTANLLTDPTENFPLEFTNAAIDRIYSLVRGQPYLTQLIGHYLVRNYNQKMFEQGELYINYFTPEDVDELVALPDFYEQGRYYFEGVWGQAEHSEPPGQLDVVTALAHATEPLTVEAITLASQLEEMKVAASLKTLRQHDVVMVEANGRYDFAVPLMRRWLREVKLK